MSVEVSRILHQPILGSRTLHWDDESACQATAQVLAARPALRDALLTLEGGLGAGKTTFVRHLLRALGVSGRIKSPTYAVLESYELPGLTASHLDFYRFDDPREWEDAGLREVFAAPGLKMVEWPDHAGALLPLPDLHLCLTIVGDTARRAEFSAYTPVGLELLP